MTAKSDLLLLFRALEFAARKHRDQRRKDVHATPYINHPIALARVLIEEGDVVDPIVLASAVLHDTIEDTKTTYVELASAFGPEVADVVQEVTDDKALSKDERKAKQVERAPGLSGRAKLVKLADKTCNLRDIVESPPEDWDEARKAKYFQWADDVVTNMGVIEGKMMAVYQRASRMER